MKRLSESVYVFEDSCQVYVVVRGTEAVLIDFGSGAVLDALPAIGVEKAAAVLMTHHHRDQAQGLHRAADAGIPIWVPHQEQDLFHSADVHWQSREVENNYNMRQDRFSLLESVPVEGNLKDYAEIEAGGTTFTVVPTPGHTIGSVTLLAELDGVRIAFSGDLIMAPGKVWSMAAFQWSYNGMEGIPASIASLLDLKERWKPERLFPSHGEPMNDAADATDTLVAKLSEMLQLRKQNPRLFLHRDHPYEEVTPHLLRSKQSFANYYVLLSDSGKALLFDFGYDFFTGFPSGPDRASRRPWLYSIPALKEKFGVTKIDVVLPTHFHDDHVAGFNLLRDVEGTEVWAAENFADVLRRPERYNLPCLWYDPIPVDRELPLEKAFRWEEYEFTLYEQSGHTLYAVAISFEADGRKVLVIGDQYQMRTHNYVYHNGFRIHDYAASAELYRRLKPELILAGHNEPHWVEPDYFDDIERSGRELERLHRELLPLGEVDFGAEGFGAKLYPYRAEGAIGEELAFEAEIVNPFNREETAVVRVAVPDGWRWEPVPGNAYAVTSAASGDAGNGDDTSGGDSSAGRGSSASAGESAPSGARAPGEPKPPRAAVGGAGAGLIGFVGASDRFLAVRLAPNEKRTVRFLVRPPAGLSVRRARVAVDLAVGGRRFGQQAEALVTLR